MYTTCGRALLGSVNRLAVLCSNGAPMHPFQWKKTCCCQASAQARSAPAPWPTGLAHRLTNFGSFPVVAADLTKSRFASTLDSECLKSNLVNAVPAWEPLGSRFEGQNRLFLYHRSNLNLLSLTLNRHFPKEDKRVSQMARWRKVLQS